MAKNRRSFIIIAAEGRPYVKEIVLLFTCTQWYYKFDPPSLPSDRTSMYVHINYVKFDPPSLPYACTSTHVHSNTFKFDPPPPHVW